MLVDCCGYSSFNLKLNHKKQSKNWKIKWERIISFTGRLKTLINCKLDIILMLVFKYQSLWYLQLTTFR